MKVHGKDGRLKKFRKKDKHRQQKKRGMQGSGDRSLVKKHASSAKKEPKEVKEVKETKPAVVEPKVEEMAQQEAAGSGPEEDDDAARSRKLLHKLARQSKYWERALYACTLVRSL